jgi:hypothetical protein
LHFAIRIELEHSNKYFYRWAANAKPENHHQSISMPFAIGQRKRISETPAEPQFSLSLQMKGGLIAKL